MAMTDKQLLSDHFTPWSASPYHLLHPFMQPIMPTTILVLGHIEKSKQNLENFKQHRTKPKTKTPNILRECLVLTQKIFFGFPSCFVFCLKWKNKSNCFLFFVWILSIKISTNKKTQGTFWFLRLLDAENQT